MKVIICNFFSDEGIEDKIGRLVSRQKKLAGNNLRVFCLDEPTQKKLESAGISSETFYDYERSDDDDEFTWAKAYELSEELHSSAEGGGKLKYSGINFLTFEHCHAYYIYAIRLASLFKRMVKQNCAVLIVVAPKQYSVWVRDINSPNIKTIKYNYTKTFVTRLYHQVLNQGYQLLAGIFVLVKAYFKRLAAGTQPVSVQVREQKQRKALFVIRTSLYARPALAIYDQCLLDGVLPYVATDDRTLVQLLQSRHIGFSVKPLFSVSLLSLASRMGKILVLFFRLKRHISSFYVNSGHPDAKPDEFSAAYLFRETLLANLPWLCYDAITDIAFLERMIKMTSPDIMCLMPQDHFFPQMASALAKEKYGIPTLACSAAWETGTSSSWRRHLHADKLATSGEKMRDIYIASGLEPERVFATGIAHFDRLFKRDREQDRQTLLGCGVDPNKEFIIFATDVMPMDEAEAMLVGVIDAVLKVKDTQLVVKLHPRDDLEAFQAIVKPYHDSRIQVVKDIDLYALLSNCQLLITKGSTVALEAMLIGKPVIILDLSDHPVAVPYVKEGAAFGVSRKPDIEPAILKMLYDGETRSRLKAGSDNFVRNWAGEPDGKASHRIVMLMKDMIAANIA